MKRHCSKCNSVFTLTHHRQVICPECRARCIECGKTLSHGSTGNICKACMKLDDTGHERAALRQIQARQARELHIAEPPDFRVRSLAETVACATPAAAQHRESCMTGGCAARCHSTAGVPSYE